MNLSEFIQTGKLLKPHGFKGEIELKLNYLLNDNSALASFFVEASPSPLPYFLEYIQSSAGKLLVKLEDVDNLEQAKGLSNKNIYCLKADFDKYYEAIEDELYSGDFLIGLELLNQKGEILGEISDVFENKMDQRLLQIFIEEKEVLIPFVEEQVIEIDEANLSLKYTIPDGLIDVYLSQ